MATKKAAGTKKGGKKAAKKQSKKTAKKQALKLVGDAKFSQTDAVEKVLGRKKLSPSQITAAATEAYPETFAGTANPGASIRALLQRSNRFRPVMGEDGSATGTWEVIPAAERVTAKQAAAAEGDAPAAETPAPARRGKKATESTEDAPAPKRRGRKAAAEGSTDEAAAPAKPKRQRRKKAAAEEIASTEGEAQTESEPTVELDEAAIAEASGE